MNRKFHFLPVILLMVLLAGCQSAAPSQAPEDSKPTAQTETGSDPTEQSIRFTAGTYLCGDTYYFFDPDGVSGSATLVDTGTGFAFTYEAEGNRITFHMGDIDNNTAATVTALGEDAYDVEWDDGRRETMTFVSNDGPGDLPDSDPDSFYRNAYNWFTSQISEYQYLDGTVCGDAAVFLTRTEQFLQVFVVEMSGSSFEVTAMRDGQMGVPAGFTAYVLATGDLTVIFGDTDTRDFTQAKVELSDGLFELRPLTGYQPYLIALEGYQEVSDVAFSAAEGYEARYSEYFSEDLMAASASADIPPLT